MLKKLRTAAQTTAEYAIIIAIVVGAVIAMQVYVKRGIQGRIRDVVHYKGNATDTEAHDIFTTNQYEPYYSESNMTSTSDAQRTETMASGGGVTKDIASDVSTRTGTQITRNVQQN